ncbi:hypothetical protein AB4144_58890, partial [Rhizobiaceae sp. 2RAB30]
MTYWLKAGQRANYRSAEAEAVAHLTNGLDLLTHLPDGPGRDSFEIDLQLELGVSLSTTKGRHSEETMTAYARAH